MRFVTFLAAVLVSFVSCSSETPLEKARREYDEGRYREAVFLVRHHLRRGGEPAPELYFLEGRSWLRLGVAANAEAAFEKAFGEDSTWASRIAGVLRDEAVSSMESGRSSNGRRYMLRAISYDADLDFGKYDKTAGEMLLAAKDFSGAISYLSRYLEAFPDTAGAAEVMLNLGSAYEGDGEDEEAIEIYTLFQERYPKSRLCTTARWKQENLRLKTARELYDGGDAEEAELILVDLAGAAANPMIRERAYFLLAEICEGRGDIEKAIQYYTEVVNLDLHSSGRLSEQAKERIERFEMSRFK
jgi:tetratricopeptide (TPR) repeat protein